MSGFSFPPPPPPPPPAATQPPPQQDNRGSFHHRGSRGRGRGNNRGGFQRGGYQQYSSNPGTRNPGGLRTDGRSQPLAHTTSIGQSGTPESMTGAMFDGFQSQSSHVLYGQDTSLGYSQPVRIAQSPSFRSGFKRKHNQAFDSIHGQTPPGKLESKPKVPAAPVVPSFGFSLPTKPPPIEPAPIAKELKTNKRKQRTNNMFGLTPRGEEPEHSDDDVDEEAAFAQGGHSISIQHRGLSIQLNTAADVAAWIAERKKKFPTQAKVAARKAVQDAARQKAQEARNAEKLRRLEEREKAMKAMKKGKNQRRKEKNANIKNYETNPSLAATERTEPDDPLARIAQLEEQLKQAKEALAHGSTLASTETAGSGSAQSLGVQQDSLKQHTPNALGSDHLQRLPASTIDEGNSKVGEHISRLVLAYSSDDDNTGGSISEPSSEEPSSASEDSGLDSGSDSDSEPPEEESAKSRRPVHVPPPLREGPNKLEVCKQFANTGRCRNGSKCMRSHHAVCKFFAKHGHCKFGSKCRMSHDVTPNTGTGGATRGDRTKIMTLRDRMIEQELRKEAEVGVQVIKYLAEHDFFKDD